MNEKSGKSPVYEFRYLAYVVWLTYAGKKRRELGSSAKSVEISYPKQDLFHVSQDLFHMT